MHGGLYIFGAGMNINEFRNKAHRIRGWTVPDPWGTACKVGWIEGGFVWVWYEGLDVPFERSLASMVDAANGVLINEPGQFEKSFVLPSGIGVTFIYEPFWRPGEDELRRSALNAWRG